MARRSTVTLYSAPLPECRRCAAPMRRERWHLMGGVCSTCATTAEAFAAAERAAHLRTFLDPARARAEVDARIERLARRRAGRPSLPP